LPVSLAGYRGRIPHARNLAENVLHHPDFAAFAVRIGRAIGRESEAIHALKSAEHDKSAFCVENDLIGSALLDFVKFVSKSVPVSNLSHGRLLLKCVRADC
jgi:hypothetical protein